MAGTLLLLKPLPPPVAEFAYSATLKALNIESLSPSERVKKLLECPISDFWTKITPSIPLLPVIDEEIIISSPTYKQLAGTRADVVSAFEGAEWCEKIMIGDCQFDAGKSKLVMDRC